MKITNKTLAAPRTQWKAAWRACRALNWGTLHFTFRREVGDFCRDAYGFTRREPVLTARRFKALGYYARGFKRI